MEFEDIPTINDIPVPDEDEQVKEELQRLGQPVFINGEDDDGRRERLKNLLNHDNGQGELIDEDDEDNEDEEFYTPGPEVLYNTRLRILRDSLSKASDRLKLQRQIVKENPEFIKVLKFRRDINSKLSLIELCGSQVIPDITRAISSVKFSNQSDLIACGSWDGSIHVLNSTDLNPVTKLSTGHIEKVGSLDWRPDTEENILLSGGNDGNIRMWGINANTPTTNPLSTLADAHTDRITSTMFHPINDLAISTSLDQTWKLWDLTKQTELYQQEGHSKGIFCGSVHPDGSLFLSGGLDGIIYVWDLRSGRALMPLQKHMQGIYGLDWSPNGHEFASASGDCSVKIWDMRKLDHSGKELHTIPAHTKLVSNVKFFRKCTKDVQTNNGTFLVTSSYDGIVNVWSADNWVKVNTLKGHGDKVMSCDIGVMDDHFTIVSSGWDRSVKLWKNN